MARAQLTIRQARPEDAQAITRIHAAGWREGYGAFFEHGVLTEAIEERRSRWVDLLQKTDLGGSNLFVGEHDSTIVKFAHAGPAYEHQGEFEVYSFYADPRRWGTGVAQELMLHVLDFAWSRGHGRVYLSAYSESARARRFYEKLGFHETGHTTESRLPRGVITINIEYVNERG